MRGVLYRAIDLFGDSGHAERKAGRAKVLSAELG